MRFAVGTCGTQTAAMLTGGYQTPPGTPSAIMQSYDGSSWTTIPQTYPTSADTPAFRTSGTQTAIISAGGNSQATTSLDWDGSSWTANNPLAVGVSAQVQQGTQTASLVATGHPAPSGGYSTKLQEYDGTNWSLSPATFSTGRSQAAGGGTTASVQSSAFGSQTEYVRLVSAVDFFVDFGVNPSATAAKMRFNRI